MHREAHRRAARFHLRLVGRSGFLLCRFAFAHGARAAGGAGGHRCRAVPAELGTAPLVLASLGQLLEISVTIADGSAALLWLHLPLFDLGEQGFKPWIIMLHSAHGVLQTLGHLLLSHRRRRRAGAASAIPLAIPAQAPIDQLAPLGKSLLFAPLRRALEYGTAHAKRWVGELAAARYGAERRRDATGRHPGCAACRLYSSHGRPQGHRRRYAAAAAAAVSSAAAAAAAATTAAAAAAIRDHFGSLTEWALRRGARAIIVAPPLDLELH